MFYVKYPQKINKFFYQIIRNKSFKVNPAAVIIAENWKTWLFISGSVSLMASELAPQSFKEIFHGSSNVLKSKIQNMADILKHTK